MGKRSLCNYEIIYERFYTILRNPLYLETDQKVDNHLFYQKNDDLVLKD